MTQEPSLTAHSLTELPLLNYDCPQECMQGCPKENYQYDVPCE